MKRKILVFGIVLCMLITMAVTPVGATVVNSGTCGDNLTWTLDDVGILTISGSGAMENYGYPHYAPWYLWSSVNTVIIQNGVTSIGDGAFMGCSNLENITIPDSVTSIGVGAFYSCNSLISITIPDSVTSIGTQAFVGCCSLTSITIPDNVTNIGTRAFSSCTSLTSITIGNGVTSIGNQAFYACNSLTSITIPESVTSIGYRAFKGDSMEEIAVSQNNQNYSSENGVLFNKNKTSLIDCPSKKTGSYTIPNSVTTIIGHAFDNCSNLTSITIPNSVASICEYAFTVCSSLTSITIPDSVTSIGENAFRLCSSLTSVTIPNSMTNISKGAFESCESLTDVYYGGIKSEWDRISIGLHNAQLTNAFIHCNDISSKQLTNVQDNSGNTLTLLENAVLDIGENLYFRNGYVDASKGYIKTGDRKITGSNIHFTNEGKIRLDDGENAKIVRDNGDGTTDQGFVFGKYNPSGIVKVTLDATGEAGGVDYTGKTVEHEFDFTSSEMYGLINFGFAINNIPKPIKFYVHED